MSRSEHFNSGAVQLRHQPLHQGGDIVAEVGGSPVGYLTYHRQEVDGHHSLHVGNVSVHREHQGRGIAESMYDLAHRETGLPFAHDAMAQTPQGYGVTARLAEKHPGRHGWYAPAPGGTERFTTERPPYPFDDETMGSQ